MAGQLTIDTLKASSGVLATQNGMTGIAKAWVQFNGTTGGITGSFNVGSITKSSTGIYLANFTTVMPNANYAATMSFRPNTGDVIPGSGATRLAQIVTYSTGYCEIRTGYQSPGYGASEDFPILSVAVFSA